jgi:hypothetical protein
MLYELRVFFFISKVSIIDAVLKYKAVTDLQFFGTAIAVPDDAFKTI